MFGFPILVGMFVGQLSGEGGKFAEQIALCQNGHNQSRLGIQTVACRMEIKKPETTFRASTGELQRSPASRRIIDYWQDGEQIRAHLQWNPHGLVQDFLWKDGVLKIQKQDLSGNRETDINKSGVLHEDRTYPEFGLISPWFYGLFAEIGPNNVFPDAQTVVQSVEQERLNGHDCYKIVSEWKGQLRKVAWFDGKQNFLVRRLTVYHRKRDDGSFDEGWRFENEVLAFREWKPGFPFPQTVVRRTFRGGKEIKDEVEEITFQNVRINEPIPAAVFTLTFLEGTNVTDLRKGIVYRTGADESPKGVIRPQEPPEQIQPTQFPTEMKKDSLGWPAFLGIGLGITLAAGGGAYWIWRRRLAPTAQM